MNTPFKVHWATVADDDLKNIILYIAEDSPQNVEDILLERLIT